MSRSKQTVAPRSKQADTPMSEFEMMMPNVIHAIQSIFTFGWPDCSFWMNFTYDETDLPYQVCELVEVNGRRYCLTRTERNGKVHYSYLNVATKERHVFPKPFKVYGINYVVTRSLCDEEVLYYFTNDTTGESCYVDESMKVTMVPYFEICKF
jgi:hypothetical protein